MAGNESLRFGFDYDKDYFIDMYMQYQFYMPIVGLFTFHSIMQYLLFIDKKMMPSLRRMYIGTHLSLILNEWTFCFAFHIYPVNPYGALYCEGFICNLGINKQILMGILSLPVILICVYFVPLSGIMHQAFLPSDSRWKLSSRAKITLVAALNVLLYANVAGFSYFGRDHENAVKLMEEEPLLIWLKSRGGTLFLFGPPGDAQYFKWELFFLAFSILLITPFLCFFTVDAMINIAQTTSRFQSGLTQKMARRMFHIFLIQCLGAFICYIVPLAVMLSFMIIDASTVHGWICATLRIALLALFPTLFSINGHQTCIFFIFKNPTYRKIIAQKLIVLLSSLGHSTKRGSDTFTMNTTALNVSPGNTDRPGRSRTVPRGP